MKLYVLCSYSDGLNDPSISNDYLALYKRMAKSYHMALDGVCQSEEEKENSYLNGFRAVAVIDENWYEWSITELEWNCK